MAATHRLRKWIAGRKVSVGDIAAHALSNAAQSSEARIGPGESGISGNTLS